MHVCAECGQRYDRGGYCASDGQPLAETSDPLLGTEVGRYRLARLLGEGGMGRVYLAVQPVIGSRVAVKILSDQCARDPGLLERFFAEARAVNLIRHESIVNVIDMAKLDDGRPYIVMEHVQGVTLKELVHHGDAPLGGVLQVMTEVLSALAAAHAIGIVHRDLKPDNVLVTVEGHAKVLDFGIAKLSPGLANQLSPRTQTGALLGTPAYMAPEQISGSGAIDARTDLYAAGIVLFEAITGRVPFRGETLFDLMRQHLEEAPPAPRLYRGDLPASLEHVILTALAKDPAARFQTAGAMMQALHHAAADLSPDHWRALSTRGGVITGGRPSATRLHAPSMLRKPSLAPTPPGATRPMTEQPRAPRRKLVLIAGILASAAIATGVTWLVVARSPGGAAGERTDASLVASTEPPAPPVGSGSATAIEPTTIGSGSSVVVTPDRPVTVRAKRPPAPPPAQPPVPAPVPVVTPVPVPVPPSKPTTTIRIPADYNPKRFDPVAYLPKAEQLARQLIADARLTSFEFDPVFPDGRVDLTIEGRDREYNFRSAKASARPKDLPRNLPHERACMVHVELGPTEVTATIRASEDCDDNLVRRPRCTLASVWKQALANGTPNDVVARIGWLFDEKWFFDVDLEGRGGGVSTFEDRCP